MTQPTFPDGPPVPLMTDGVIDAATLRQLGADLHTAAEVLSVREKGGADAYAGADDRSLTLALDRLLAGTARAVQIRYLYEGHEWTDTIFSNSHGFRVVRCRHE
jgi:hypothetical protein